MRYRDVLCGVLVTATLAWAAPAIAGHESGVGSRDADDPAAASPYTDDGRFEPAPMRPDQQEQRLVGRVMDLDRDNGMVVLATERGVVVVHATPESLADIDVGDIIAVVVRPMPTPERV